MAHIVIEKRIQKIEAEWTDTRALVFEVVKLVGADASPEQISAACLFARRALEYRGRRLRLEQRLVEALLGRIS